MDLLRSTLDSLSEGIAALDADGGICLSNVAWNRSPILGLDHGPGCQENFIRICEAMGLSNGDLTAAEIGRGARRVLAGNEAVFDIEFIREISGQERWFHLRVSRCAGEGTPRAVVSQADVTERKMAVGRLERLASVDGLTGLPNRRVFQDRLTLSLAEHSRSGRKVGVLLLDLDGFKGVNDGLGHSTGDRLLRLVALRLSRSTRSGDTVARIGGDEFALVLPGIDSDRVAFCVAERIIRTMREPFVMGRKIVRISGSLGISMFPQDGKDPETLLRNADIAMYQVKGRGRDGFEFWSGCQHSNVGEE